MNVLVNRSVLQVEQDSEGALSGSNRVAARNREELGVLVTGRVFTFGLDASLRLKLFISFLSISL